MDGFEVSRLYSPSPRTGERNSDRTNGCSPGIVVGVGQTSTSSATETSLAARVAYAAVSEEPTTTGSSLCSRRKSVTKAVYSDPE